MFLFWGLCELRFKWNWCYLHWHWCVSYFFPLLIALSTGLFYCCTKCKLSLLGGGLFLSLTFLRKMFIRLVTSVGQRKRVPTRNRTSDLRIPRSDALPLSHRDSTVSEVYYEVHMTRVLTLLLFGLSSIVLYFFVCFYFVLFFSLRASKNCIKFWLLKVKHGFQLSLSFFSGPYFLSMLSIDECFDEIHQCDSLAKCHNTPGNYSCQCPDGYSSQWKDCIGEAGV